jgi:hypothetical protein
MSQAANQIDFIGRTWTQRGPLIFRLRGQTPFDTRKVSCPGLGRDKRPDQRVGKHPRPPSRPATTVPSGVNFGPPCQSGAAIISGSNCWSLLERSAVL